MNKQITLTLILLLIVVGSSYGQKDFRIGFIITNGNDTIQGQVDYRSNAKNYESCVFKDEQGEKEYYPNQIRGFGYKNDKFFSSQIIEGSFVEVLVIGDLNLFRSKEKFHIRKDTSFFDLESITRRDIINGRFVNRDISKWRGILSYTISDCLENPSELASSINLRAKDLTQLVIKYNECRGTEFTEYTSNKPWAKYDYGITLGISRSILNTINISGTFAYMDDSYKSIDPSIGLLIAISSPRISEVLAFQGELHFLQSRYSSLVEFTSPKEYHDTQIDVKTISIPLSLKYSFPEENYGLFLQGGVTFDYHFESNTKLLSERIDGTVVNTSESTAFDINKNQLGYWGGLGINSIFQKCKIGISLRYYHVPRLNEDRISNGRDFTANINRVSIHLIFLTK
jgi:hypothetical protein